MLAPQIEKFYFELANSLVTSALCVVHQRFSTNTFPSWKLAHPYRYVSHNGEINTIRGNISWMNARQSVLASPQYDGKIDDLYPVIVPGGRGGREPAATGRAQFRAAVRGRAKSATAPALIMRRSIRAGRSTSSTASPRKTSWRSGSKGALRYEVIAPAKWRIRLIPSWAIRPFTS